MKLSEVSLGLAFGLILSSCATPVFTVKSEPPQADVFFQPPGGGEKKQIGKTPLTMPMTELRQILGNDVVSGQYFPITIERQGFVPEVLQIPATKFGTLVTAVDVKLKEGQVEKEQKTAKMILDHLFLAQKFALAQQFERAQIELDKILADYPSFARAMSMRASIFFAQKNFNESLKWYEEALKADPTMDDAVKMASKVRVLMKNPLDPSVERLPAAAPGKNP